MNEKDTRIKITVHVQTYVKVYIFMVLIEMQQRCKNVKWPIIKFDGQLDN